MVQSAKWNAAFICSFCIQKTKHSLVPFACYYLGVCWKIMVTIL